MAKPKTKYNTLVIIVFLLFIVFIVELTVLLVKLKSSSENLNSSNNSVTFKDGNIPPTLKPLQGPGVYACDPNGVCKNYSDVMRKNCTTTFADHTFLNQCGNIAKRCKN